MAAADTANRSGSEDGREGLCGLVPDSDSDEDATAAAAAYTSTIYPRSHARQGPRELQLTLVSSRHSLWGHLLWNAG
jgi:hypothetical protein